MENIINFLQISSGSGHGSGNGDGDGHGYGDSHGYGSGNGSGYGSGNGSGNGYGPGYGSGYGYGDGHGSGHGSGYGYGYGDGHGSGHGSGNGDGIVTINGQKVYMVDNIQTLIDSVHGNYAKGNILNSDLTFTPCYIAKCGDCFAHGESLHQAQEDAREKYESNIPIEVRIKMFTDTYPYLETEASHKDLFRWHYILTGSCDMGRREWCKDHYLDPENGTMTIRQFLELTMDSYGGDVIKQVYAEYTTST